MNKMPLHILTRMDKASTSASQCRSHAPNTSSWCWVQLTSIFSLPCVPGSSGLDPGLQLWPLQCWGRITKSTCRWWDPVPNSIQKKLIAFLAAKTHCCLVHYDCKAASQPFSLQPVLVHVVVPPQVQNLVFPFLNVLRHCLPVSLPC